MTKREFATLLVVAAVIYALVVGWPAPDIKTFYSPWVQQIRETGLSVPVGNYSPPYLYLLALTSALPTFVVVKLLAVVGAAWLAFCASRLAHALGGDPKTAAIFSILLPTVILNAPVLGQCDTLWVGCCLLAVTEALKERTYRMAVWAGVAFAFKAQAAFLAPFCIAYIISRRAAWAAAIPPVVYAIAIAPAAAAGWPMHDLLTIYVGQAQLDYIGDAPNLWAIPAWLGVRGSDIFPIGYALGAFTALAIAFVRPRNLLTLALLSSIALPFFLPKMLERAFFLADVLSLVSACGDRRRIVLAVLVQVGSTMSILGELTKVEWLNPGAAVPMALALSLAVRAVMEEAGTKVSSGPR